MYVKVTRSGPRRYVHLVEAYRDPVHGTPRHATWRRWGDWIN